MASGAVDYAASYFKYKTPTPIIGAPSHKTLKRLKQELRANASSVESDLGSGDHGFLGLVLDDTEYAKVSLTAFDAPEYPNPLAIPTNTTQVEALSLREQHKEAKRAYYECKNVEKALQRHVQDAIEDKYLESMVDEDTQLITEDIPEVLKYLFDVYGKVPSEEVKQKEAELRTMSYHPADPMILLHNPIEKLKKMAESAGIPYTQDQLLDIGLTVNRNTRDFERALGDWELLQPRDKTWDRFKKHFKEAQKQLKAIRGPTMQQAGYHHANHLADQLRQDIEKRDTDLLTVIQSAMETNSVAPSVAPSDISMSTASVQQQANSIQGDPIQLEMLKLLQQMQQAMFSQPPTRDNNNDNSYRGSQNNNNDGNSNRGRRRQNRKTPDNASYNRTKTEKYCWTHGATSHDSAQCRTKAQGHQDAATFNNRMGGSNAFCPP